MDLNGVSSRSACGMGILPGRFGNGELIVNLGRNVLGGELQGCSTDPMTGFYRNGMCSTGPGDHGLHVVCVRLTNEFLEFSRANGNDLSTPIPEFGFPGLEEGDKWCLCVTRWKEALEAGHAPQVYIEATHVSALEYVDREDLQAHAVHDEA